MSVGDTGTSSLWIMRDSYSSKELSPHFVEEKSNGCTEFVALSRSSIWTSGGHTQSLPLPIAVAKFCTFWNTMWRMFCNLCILINEVWKSFRTGKNRKSYYATFKKAPLTKTWSSLTSLKLSKKVYFANPFAFLFNDSTTIWVCLFVQLPKFRVSLCVNHKNKNKAQIN